MKDDDDFEVFMKSGKIEDYLKYKRLLDGEYANDSQRLDNKRTDDRGE
ncbi:MAG: hypothetical protein IJT65_05810 [Eubacterium sp.]|nr:hypothetical protein [Eubacterium sp.]